MNVRPERLLWLALLLLPGHHAQGGTVALTDVDSGLTSPSGSYRWLDVADQAYSAAYRDSYNYTQAAVAVSYEESAHTFHGTLNAVNLKPNFAYQLKLVGQPGTDSNERIGLAGRWWEQSWTGSSWSSGWNLNDKGDGSSPNPNDLTYFARRDIANSTSPTGRQYLYTGYLVLDYFVTDPDGNATLSFQADSSYHVLWKTSQRGRSSGDGPLKIAAFDASPADPAYDADYDPQSVGIFGEWERLPTGGVFLQPGSYACELILTEESFHGSGGTYAGAWAAAMAGSLSFDIESTEDPPVASFEHWPEAGAAPLTVYFTDHSTGVAATWHWDFGDGQLSNQQHPTHEFLLPDAYTVTLTVIGPAGSSSSQKTVIVGDWPVPGDANGDCVVNILDLIFVRNRLSWDTGSGDNWQADVNNDATINILDMIFVRNKLNTRCE